jgi:hypothetical protein
VEGQGTTEKAQNYTYRVRSLEPGRHVFRLKQIDFDGTFDYSPQVEVVVSVAGEYAMSQAYPNPFNPRTSVSLAVGRRQEVEARVFDILGRQVEVLWRGEMAAHASRAFVWEADRHPSGLYFIRVQGEHFIEMRRVMLVK